MTLCGAESPAPASMTAGRLVHCTREQNHEGDHIAAIGPYVPGEQILAQWPRTPPPPGDASDDMAVDGDGRPLPHTPAETRSILAEMLDRGEILAVILRDVNGDLGVQVFGPPSREILDVLMTTTKAYRRTLAGH